MQEIQLSAAAEDDLIGIWRYISRRWGVDQADLYLDELEQAIALLATDAGIGADRNDVREGYRVLFVNRHAVYYTASPNSILISRVLHGRMDPKSHTLPG